MRLQLFLPFSGPEAEAAFERGEVPVGCVIVDGANGQVLARAGNRTEEFADPTAAELLKTFFREKR